MSNTAGSQMKVDVECRARGAACVVRIEGEIDAYTAPDLRTRLQGMLDTGCWNAVIDLAGVTYLDSSALGLIVWLSRVLEPQGGRIVLAGATGDVLRLLEISGLNGAAPGISAAESVADAIAGLTLAEPESEPLWTQTLEFPASPSVLADARADIGAIIEPLGLHESALFDVRVAVGEALSNAVRHGSAAGDVIEVAVTAYDDRVVIAVGDSGVGFDGVVRASGDPYAPSGRGIMFMRALMDQVEFSRRPEAGTVVRLVKHLATPAL